MQTLFVLHIRLGMGRHRPKKRNRISPPLTLCLSLFCVRALAESAPVLQPPLAPSSSQPAPETAQGFMFDPALFRGSALNQDALKHLGQAQSATAGQYKVDIYVNQQFFEQRHVRFVQLAAAQQIEACLSAEQLKRAAIIIRDDFVPANSKQATAQQSERCDTLADLVGAGQARFDISRLRLDLSIPNSRIKQKPSGYIDPAEWQSGDSIGFINYIGHYYHSAYRFSDQTLQQDVAHLALHGGINWGKWQFRQQTTLNHQQQRNTWQSMGMTLRRPLPSLDSELTLGQLNSRGRFFSGLSFHGLQLSSDERMLPASQRGYAPVIQGIAKTPAQVIIYQNEREIYQLHVAPGPFRISDLFPSSASGDLKVRVLEADGTSSSFEVPFSAVPESVRQGAFKYNLEIGQSRGLADDVWLGTLSHQYGLSNRITLNSGIRLSEHYQSSMLGSAYTHRIGAFATDISFSRAQLPQQRHQGWLFSSSYSKSIPATQTTLSLSGYRYSTAGYRELADHIGQRHADTHAMAFVSEDRQERSRLVVSMQQMLGAYGNLYLSSSARYFREHKPTDYQLQLGYSKSLHNGISIQLNINRSLRHGEETRPLNPTTHNDSSSSDPISNNLNNLNNLNNPNSSMPEQGLQQQLPAQLRRITDTSIGLSVSIPLGMQRSKTHNLMLTATQQDQGSQYQSSLSGSLDQEGQLNYSLGLSDDSGHAKPNGYAMLQKRMQYANLGLSASRGENYWQASGHVQGAVALHRGGVTLGHYLADTFALIEAKGAQGARVLNTQSTVIDRYGYALLPSLTPYQYNAISLNPEGMSGQAELSTGYARIAPYAGAAVKINFKTRQGHALLIRAHFAHADAVPMGAEVFDAAGHNIGMVAQNGQIYLRSETLSGQLLIRWGERAQDSCRLQYQLQSSQLNANITKLNASCEIDPIQQLSNSSNDVQQSTDAKDLKDK